MNFTKLLILTVGFLLLSGCITSDADNEGPAIEDSGVTIGSTDSGYDSDAYGSVQTGGLTDEGYNNVETTEGKFANMTQNQLLEQNTIFFRFDNSQVDSEYFPILNAFSKYLLANPNAKIVIQGHTDKKGTPEYNIALGENRAKSIAKYLQSTGVNAGQFSIVSYGEEKLADPADSDFADAKNRRAVLVK